MFVQFCAYGINMTKIHLCLKCQLRKRGRLNFLTFKDSSARICKSLRIPGIDSNESIPPAYVAWRGVTSNRVVVPVRLAGNRFLGSLKGLQIRVQASRNRFLITCRTSLCSQGRSSNTPTVSSKCLSRALLNLQYGLG